MKVTKGEEFYRTMGGERWLSWDRVSDIDKIQFAVLGTLSDQVGELSENLKRTLGSQAQLIEMMLARMKKPRGGD